MTAHYEKVGVQILELPQHGFHIVAPAWLKQSKNRVRSADETASGTCACFLQESVLAVSDQDRPVVIRSYPAMSLKESDAPEQLWQSHGGFMRRPGFHHQGRTAAGHSFRHTANFEMSLVERIETGGKEQSALPSVVPAVAMEIDAGAFQKLPECLVVRYLVAPVPILTEHVFRDGTDL